MKEDVSPAHSLDRSGSSAAFDRDGVILRIAEFYGKHEEGVNTMVNNLIKLYREKSVYEQSLKSQYEELGAVVLILLMINKT